MVASEIIKLISNQQFKKINQDGCLELIRAIDDKRISISTAAKLASLSHEQQCQILLLNKKEIIAFIKRKNPSEKIKNHKLKDLSKTELLFLLKTVCEWTFSNLTLTGK